MAAFPSFQYLFDSSSVFSSPLPSTPSTINIKEPNNAPSYFSQFSTATFLYQNLDHSTNIPAPSNNEASFNKNSMDNSSSIITADININNNRMHDHHHHQTNVKLHTASPIEKKRKSKHALNSSNSAQSKDMREVRGKKQKKLKDVEEKKDEKKEEKKEAPTGYIHVRARRGQATDSHSLAERVRRERISERMKLLQALVPGCDKVTGKALMLDEIINYVQSLQNQVEFLSMKLASVNPMFYDFGMDLESFMVRPDQLSKCMQDLSGLPSPMQSINQCSPTTSNNNYPLLDNSANSLIFQQAHIPNDFSQGNRQMLWGLDEQRQKIFNQSGFNNNCLFSFH